MAKEQKNSVVPHYALARVKKGNAAIYDEFVDWMVLPPAIRRKLHIETLEEFAASQGVHRNTLTNWSKQPQFIARVKEARDNFARMRTTGVVDSIYEASTKKYNPLSQKLWMQIFEGFTEKTEVSQTQKVEVGVNDIRFIIDGLPEPERTKFHGYIDELINFANAVRNARSVDDTTWDERPAQAVLHEANNDAQEPSYSQAADTMAAGDSGSIRSDMERPLQSHHYQSTARWW